jgi:hypothetical protein
MRCAVVAAASILALSSSALAAAPRVTFVVCAPGYPGTSEEAQASMDAFASALASAAGWPKGSVVAVYEPTEKGGLDRLRTAEASVTLAPTPFLVKHGKALDLAPHLQVQQRGGGLTEVWTLVAKKGRVTSPAALAGFTIASIAGYAPEFVRGALAEWGPIPESVRIVQSNQVLSSLRKVAAGEELAVLLDGAQSAALESLPFAGDLEVVVRSQPLPSAFVCTVDRKLPAPRWKALEGALVKLGATTQGAAALEGIRIVRFVPADPGALAAVRRPAGNGR